MALAPGSYLHRATAKGTARVIEPQNYAAEGCAACVRDAWRPEPAAHTRHRVARKVALDFLSFDPGGLAIQNTDCGDRNRVYAWATAITATPEAAQAKLARVRQTVKDAYVKRCDVKTGSLLALRMPAVDLSIADVPADAVNWQNSDRISEARSLGDGRTLVIVRHYVATPDDPLEGRRERVILVNAAAAKTVLTEDCVGTGNETAAPGRVAFDCAREQAGDHILHTTLAFADSGGKIAAFDRCRVPRWAGARILACSAESVDASGELHLTESQFEVAQ